MLRSGFEKRREMNSEQTFAVYTTNILLKNNSHVEIIEIFEMI